MMNGQASFFAGPLSADHAKVLQALHLPEVQSARAPAPTSASDLAQHWPFGDRGARRAVVMVTDGIDNYERRFDPEDPYVRPRSRFSPRRPGSPLDLL